MGSVTVVVKMGKSDMVLKDRALAGSIVDSARVLKEIKRLEPVLRRHKGLIADTVRGLLQGDGTLSLLVDGVSLRVTLRHEALIPERNLPEVKSLLGKRFNCCVRVHTRYICPPALLKELKRKGLSRLIELRELSPRFGW